MSKVPVSSPPGGAGRASARAGGLTAFGVLRRGLAVGTTLVAVLGAGAVALPVGSAVAAEGRAFELVSPLDTEGSIPDARLTVQARPDGDAVAFGATGPFGDAVAGVTGGYSVARRSAQGWATHAVDLPQRASTGQIATPTINLSTDLTQALQFSAVALTPDAIEGTLGGGNVYLQDLITGTPTLVAASTDILLQDNLAPFGTRNTVKASSDFSHVVFETRAPLLPGTQSGPMKVYESVNGHLRLVNILPDGTPDPAGGVGRAVSSDGSRVFFEAQSDGALYARVNGSTTVPISVSRRVGDPPTPVPGRFGGTSSDGTVVYFLARAPLTEDSAGGGIYGAALYRYDFKTDTLTDETANDGGVPANVMGVSAVSEDGEYAYFTARGGAESNVPKFYVAHRGEVKLIGILTDGERGGPSQISSSPDGRHIAFTSAASLTGDDTENPDCEATNAFANAVGDCVQVYVYDALTSRLSCASCATIDGTPRHSDLRRAYQASISGYLPTQAFNDGRVFFETEARLVSGDTNGVMDVYMWDGQRSHLISSGRGAKGALMADVSSDGRDVFFFTAQQLVGTDVDGEIDLYDARVGGGLDVQRAPSASVAPCEGDGCQGKLSVPGGSSPLSTADFAGSGDPAPEARHVSGPVRVTGPKVKKGSRFVVTVKVSSAGKIAASGARVSTASRRVGKAGSYRLGLVLSVRAKRQLRKAGRSKVTVRVTFTPSSGASSSSSLSVTLKA